MRRIAWQGSAPYKRLPRREMQVSGTGTACANCIQRICFASSARVRPLVKRPGTTLHRHHLDCCGSIVVTCTRCSYVSAMAAAPRACVRCTLLCDDASLQACTLCGGDLAPPQKFRILNSPTCIDLEEDVTDAEPPGGAPRSCPACTLICRILRSNTLSISEHSRPIAVSLFPCVIATAACGGALPEPTPLPQPPRKRPKQSPKPIASQASGVATFFQKTATIPESKQEPPLSAEPPAPGCGPSLSPALVAINAESAWSASVAAAALSTSCADFRPASAAGCWTKKGAPVPYRHLAAALDALEATRSRLSKDTILTNSFRVMLAMAAPAEEVESACYLFAPAKDAQAGGHRLRPDWVEGGRPLSIPHKSITASLLEATGASKADMNRLYQELHDSGQVALALRERGGKQRLLRAPQPLTAGAVRRTLLSLADLQGTGVEKAKTTRLVGLLRAAEGTELKWLVRTFMPHMAAGVSLESSVLPALGAAAAMAAAMSARLTELLNGSAAATALGVASRSGLLPMLSTVPQSAAAVAEAAGLNQRYVEEILAVLACSKVVNLVEESPPKYHVSDETQEALSGMGLYFEEMPLLTRCAFEEVVSATKQGGGVPPSCYGPFGAWMGKLADAKHEKQLVSQLLPLLAGGEIIKKLEAGTAKVLDLGCGEGTAPCLIAKHFPKAEVVGIDAWAPSVAAATKKAEAANLPNIKFVCGDAANFGDDGAWTGQFDLVTSFDVIHDLTKPEATLGECRRVLKADGYFAMVDIRAETGVAKNIAHPMAPFLYAVSLMHCMPQGMNDGGPGLGMMWGREKALSLLKGAGFEPEIVAMEFDTFNDCYLSLTAQPLPKRSATADAVRSAQEEVRHGYALRPDVRALVEALLEDGIEGVRRRCTLHLGVPMQPMLAKACTSIQELLKRILKSVPRSVQATSPIMLSAEFKYDGQRAQIHVVPGGRVKIFSRKLDDMTYKYPDVVKAVLKSSRTQAACVLDAEIVAVVPKENAEDGTGGEGKELESKDGNKVEIAAFQSLATRKRKNVTEANAATTSVAVKVFLFDLLFLAEEPLISLPFQQRRERLKESFAEVKDLVAYAEAEDLEGNAGSAEATLEAALQRSVAMSCEGLMVKHLDSGYEPSTKRSDCWLKLKKDYVESMGDSLDLIPIGGWRGSGRKSRWVSPWLLATYDPEEGTFGSENTLRYLGRELHAGNAKAEIDAEDEGEDADEDEVEVESAESAAAEEEDDMLPSKGLAGMQLRSKAGGVETLEQPQFWFQPSEVWEIRGADITISPKHLAAQGLVDPKRGLSLRFPRFIRKREDKCLDQATTPQQLAEFSLQEATPASRLTTTTETAENDSDDDGVCEVWCQCAATETTEI
eukprot:s1130_g10.t8